MSRLICGDNLSYSMDCFETQLTNNLLVIGATGTGKSRCLIGPNIVECYGSSMIFDPKGALYKQYSEFLRNNGYKVVKLDFTNPEDSCHYNPLANIRTSQDIAEIAHALTYNKANNNTTKMDPFWDESTQILLSSLIGYLVSNRPKRDQTIQGIVELIEKANTNGDLDQMDSPLDEMFAGMRNRDTEIGKYALRCYKQFRAAPDKTLRSILVTASAKLTEYMSEDILTLTSRSDFDIRDLAKEKTAFFVICSDSKGAALETLVQLFFSQAMDRLVEYADSECENQRLPIPVQFIMDDFACGVSIKDFQKKIAIVRSRNISVCVVVQAINQLEDLYGSAGAKTIIANFDTMVFMGTNDVDTCRDIAQRVNQPLDKILYMQLGFSWVFRRGEKPVFVKNAKPVDVQAYRPMEKADKVVEVLRVA